MEEQDTGHTPGRTLLLTGCRFTLPPSSGDYPHPPRTHSPAGGAGPALSAAPADQTDKDEREALPAPSTVGPTTQRVLGSQLGAKRVVSMAGPRQQLKAERVEGGL